MTLNKGFFIGDLWISNPVILAPMAGVSDSPYRRIVKRYGAGLVYSELISSLGLLRSRKSLELARFHPEEKPVSLQIFGSRPKEMGEAARILESLGADLVDINLGCSVPKMSKCGGGACLARNLPLLQQVLESVVKAVKIPVTIKMRKGWDDQEITCFPIAKMAEEAGVKAIAIHGRTSVQGYSGDCDWEAIRKVRELVRIPVIGSGNIVTPADAKKRLEESGCAGIMVGRGLQGAPWLVRQILHYLETGEILPSPSLQERFAVLREHLESSVADVGEKTATESMRKHLGWYIKGLPHAAAWRERLVRAKGKEDLADLISAYYDLLSSRQRAMPMP